MLSLISYRTISTSADLFFGQHRLRHREFIERQGYAVRSIEGMEYDQYDTLAAYYLVFSDNEEQVLGCSRLTPVDRGCMLQDHFSHLVADPSLFSQPNTWEGTRFCVDGRLPPAKRLQILKHISVGYLEFALHFGVERIVGLMPTLILRTVFERNGIKLRRLGPVHAVGNHSKIQAACIDVARQLYDQACVKVGIESPLGLLSSATTDRHVA